MSPRPVLVVSGDDDTREMYVQGLHAVHIDVCGGASADEAVRIAAKSTPAAIVLDIHAPDDFYLCRRFQFEPATARVPVIAVSGYVTGDHRFRRMSSDMGCAAFIAKPSLPETIAHIVERVIAGERDIEQMDP